jgi:hypothetical protein
MFIFTTKVNKRILAAALVFVGAAVSVFLLASSAKDDVTASSAEKVSPPTTVKIENNDDRVNFLTSYGWEVESKPLEFMEIRIPETFNETFEKYNDMQKEQGFDLSKYKNKRVIRYTYRVLNYPTGEEDVCANLLVYKDKVIGGDVCSARLDGFMHGFEMPDSAAEPSAKSDANPKAAPNTKPNAVPEETEPAPKKTTETNPAPKTETKPNVQTKTSAKAGTEAEKTL